MTALTENRDTPEIQGRHKQAPFAVLDTEIVYAGGILAVDYADEVRMAGDTAGLKVLGRAPTCIDNTDDGQTVNVEHGIFRYANSTGSPVPRSAIGEPCFVEDDQTVAGATTNYVAAGLVHDVDSSGVWVDQTPAALATARARTPVTLVDKTAAYTVTAAEAFGGRTIFRCDNAAGVVLTLPSAVAGMRVGVQRKDATAAHDVSVQAAAGDTVKGSAAGKKIVNDTDAVSEILWLRAVSDSAWIVDPPYPTDADQWEVDNS